MNKSHNASDDTCVRIYEDMEGEIVILNVVKWDKEGWAL